MTTSLHARLSRISPATWYVWVSFAWLLTRIAVLAHQGREPWMNAQVLGAARSLAEGSPAGLERPPLPALIALPLVAAGLGEQAAVAVLYLVASLVQLAALIALLRQVFPGRPLEQGVSLTVFLLLPVNHSIHHYRNVPVLLANAVVLTIAAHWVRLSRLREVGRRLSSAAWLVVATVLGVLSRTEVLAYVGLVAALGLLLSGGRLWRSSLLCAGALGAGALALVLATQVSGVDPRIVSRYQVYTFLDSTPASWLTPECRANPTEDCRVADGTRYFGPETQPGGLRSIVTAQPALVAAKSARSALDNVWEVVGPNLSTFPGLLPLLVLALAWPPARDAFRTVPGAVWAPLLAGVLLSAVPPLTWAPPHPQYHLAWAMPFSILGGLLLAASLRVSTGQWVAGALALVYAGLSAFRYTRYTGN